MECGSLWGGGPPPGELSLLFHWGGEGIAGHVSDRGTGVGRGRINSRHCSGVLGVLLGKSEVKTFLPYCLSVTDPWNPSAEEFANFSKHLVKLQGLMRVVMHNVVSCIKKYQEETSRSERPQVLSPVTRPAHSWMARQRHNKEMTGGSSGQPLWSCFSICVNNGSDGRNSPWLQRIVKKM